MTLTSTSITDGQPIDPQYAFCAPDPDATPPTTGGDNVSPHLAWANAPDGTRSFAVVVHDPDVPADASDVNQEGKTLPVDAERTDFFHWLLVDVPPTVTEIPEGALKDGVTEGGEAPGPTSGFGIEGTNDYTSFMEGSDMEGTYGGYDGPCPPWNDERLHHYHFTVYALDTESLGLSEDGDFRGQDVRDALDGHVLAQAEIVGTYTLNPDVG